MGARIKYSVVQQHCQQKKMAEAALQGRTECGRKNMQAATNIIEHCCQKSRTVQCQSENKPTRILPTFPMPKDRFAMGNVALYIKRRSAIKNREIIAFALGLIRTWQS